ncbi:MAG: iron-sulfur cluster assembly scaffold protein, partial [Promethearchaeota archaeon]
MIERDEMPKEKFNDFCDRLEKEIINKDNKDHYEKIVELFRNPQNWGKMSDDETSAFHSERGKNGELLEFYLKINPEERVEKASFFTDGCGCMVAVASQTTLLIQGKRLDV